MEKSNKKCAEKGLYKSKNLLYNRGIKLTKKGKGKMKDYILLGEITKALKAMNSSLEALNETLEDVNMTLDGVNCGIDEISETLENLNEDLQDVKRIKR